MKKAARVIAAIIGSGAMVWLAVMTVMAIRFGELGRVMVYGILLILSLELTGIAVSRLLRKKD